MQNEKKVIKELQNHSSHISRRKIAGYFGLAVLFFVMSLTTVYFINHYFSAGHLRIPHNLFSVNVIGSLVVLLVLYFMVDGMRLYCIIRAMGFRIGFLYIVKLVFVNIFVSNVTPLATGGGVAQVYFMKQQGMPVGDAVAATSIRTILAVLILFIFTPIILWVDPNQFHMFFHSNLLYMVTGVSCAYLTVFWVVLYRMRLFKRWIFRFLLLLNMIKIVSRLRSRNLYLKISKELELFSAGFRRYFRNCPGWVTLSLIFTALFLLLLFSFSIILVKALGYHVSELTLLAFQVVVTFFMYFAPTPGATGVAEGGYGLLFSQLVHKQDIALLILSWRFLTIYIGVFIGIVVLYWEMFKRKKVCLEKSEKETYPSDDSVLVGYDF